MFMSYMHCSIIRNVTNEYWALVGGVCVCVCVQGRHCDNVTVYSEYISSMSPRRGRSHFCGVFATGRTGGFHYENLRCGRQREYGIGMTVSASRRTTSELLMRLHILVPKQTNVSLINITLTIACLLFEVDVTVLASLVALWAVFADNPRGHQRLRGRYNSVTMTTWLFSKYTSSMSLCKYRWMGCCFGGIFVAGCTGDCLFDNIRCSQRQRLRRNRHAFILWLTSELLMSPLMLIIESFTPIQSSCCDTTDWFILTWFHSISLHFILNITLINIILWVLHITLP